MGTIARAKELATQLRCFEIPRGYIGLKEAGGEPVAARIKDALFICNPFEPRRELPNVEETILLDPKDVEVFFVADEGSLVDYEEVQLGDVLFKIRKEDNLTRFIPVW